MAGNSRKSKKKSSTKKKASKGKVYIPAYKAIILCSAVIAVCMLLLLITTVRQNPAKAGQEVAAIAERFEAQPEKVSGKDNSEQKEASRETASDKKADESRESAPKPAGNSTVAASSAAVSGAAAHEYKSQQPASVTQASGEKPQVSSGSSAAAASSSGKSSSMSSASASKSASGGSAASSAAQTAASGSVASAQAASAAASSAYDFPPAKNGAQLVFVFDDGGHSLGDLKAFLALPFPVTVAVLPRIAHSKESGALVRSSGNELMLHQPMQAVNLAVNPGPGAITPQMTENEIISTLFQNITEIGPIEGMNNHEGSLITADAEKMSVILKTASENGIYFLDSRTNVETKVPYVAHELGYSWYERSIFLDNNFQENKFKDNKATRDNFLSELNKGLAIANKNGSVIMIGHVWSAEILPKYLKEAYPELVKKGYTFSVVSKSKAKKW